MFGLPQRLLLLLLFIYQGLGVQLPFFLAAAVIPAECAAAVPEVLAGQSWRRTKQSKAHLARQQHR
jgi:hypothetical protein